MEFWPEYLASSWGREFVAGGLGGMAGVIAGHPLDTVRVRLQQPRAISGSALATAAAVVRCLLASEGSFAFFKGMSSPLATIAFQNAATFQIYAMLSRTLEINDNEPLPLHRVAAAGIGAGTLQTLLITPVDLIKIHLQLNTTHRSRTCLGASNPPVKLGPLKVMQQIITMEGVRGLYRDFAVTMLRDSPNYGVYFATYEYIREVLHPGCRKNGNETVITMLTAGGCAGAISWTSGYPLDVVKSRLQALGSEGKKYSGIVDCISRSVLEEGLSVLIRGLGTAIARAYVVNAAIFCAYEMTLRFLVPQPPEKGM